jgi:alpha-L-fucosidase
MMKSLLTKTGIFLVLAATLVTMSCKPQVKESPQPDRLQWWTDAKFGLFIHWGVYSVPAGTYNGKQIESIGEWIMYNGEIPSATYKEYAKNFNPVNYNPEAWVKMAKDAGMKYIVITSKHHDGFGLFDSKVTDWDVVDASPYGKDLLRPLVEAARKEGIKIGFYYSQAQDWNHPGGGAYKPKWDSAQNGSFDTYLDNIAVPQVKEILSNYGELDILWWDTPVQMTKERAEKFQPLLAEHPRLITNNRLGGGFDGDSETPEQTIPATGFPGKNWEVCMTMNDTWGYKSYDQNWKSGKDLILKLSDIVSKGGNFLLNVGPTSLGEIPQPSIDRLKQVGDWMRTNSEAIYGTKASPFPYLPWGRATMKDQKLYLHVSNWPSDGLLKLPLMNKAGKAYLLADSGASLNLAQKDQHIEISVPAQAPDSILSIVVVEFEGIPEVLPAPTKGKTGNASSVDTSSVVTNLFDGNPFTKWKAGPGEVKAWVEVDLGADVSISNLSLSEPWLPWDNHGQEFQLQVKYGEKWKTIIEGKTDGCGHTQDFTPVTGRYFRLNISGGKSEVPVIGEWILNRTL